MKSMNNPEKIYKLEKFTENLSLSKIISNKNSNLDRQLIRKPFVCPIFNNKIIEVKNDRSYKFRINANSKKQLNNIAEDTVKKLIKVTNISDKQKDQYFKKRRIGIVFSGGPAPGGHNTVAGLFDAMKKANKNSTIFGFVMGPKGIMEGNYLKLTSKLINKYRNLGGFHMLKTGREKIDSIEKMKLSMQTCKNMNLDGIVIVGGDDSNTNAAFLAQEMFGNKTKVIGIPKTIDGDIQIKDVNGKTLCATSFGFHTMAINLSTLISNLCTDSRSDAKYWHFCKIMGRTSGHLALEIAFRTQVNLTLIGEEVKKQRLLGKNSEQAFSSHQNLTLDKLVAIICSAILKRAKLGKNFGVIVIPEGILEFIEEIQEITSKIGSIITSYNKSNKISFHKTFESLEKKLAYLENLTKMDSSSRRTWDIKDNIFFSKMPKLMKEGLLTERDKHGNFQFSQLKTEEIILSLVKNKLKKLQQAGKYKLGISKKFYKTIMNKENLDYLLYGPVLFRNWDKNKSNKLLFHHKINSEKQLFKTLSERNLLDVEGRIPNEIYKMFLLSIPTFKSQTHFYGYEGRGSHPTYFDCSYAYNLGQTAFHLINNGVTGQMACILNLEYDFNKWEPISVPIAVCMKPEKRNNKMSLVFEKSTVDIASYAFKIFAKLRKKWLTSDTHRYEFWESLETSSSNCDTKLVVLAINKKCEKINFDS